MAPFVLEGEGHEARTVRNALGEETVVLTDPMEMVRRLDISLLEAGRVSAPICGIAMTSGHHRSGLVFHLRRWIGLDLLKQSGIGTVAHLVNTADRGDWDYIDRTDGPAFSVGGYVQRCQGQLRRITRLATQATALIVHERDPEVVEPDPYPWALPTRFITGVDPHEARRRLRRIATSNIIFDRDEPPITAMVEEVRFAAEAISSYGWLFEDFAPSGIVRTEDDARYVRLQLADVAAGWGRTLIARDGLLSVAMRFRLVLYNGERLTLEEAGRLDKERAIHRRLLVGCAPV